MGFVVQLGFFFFFNDTATTEIYTLSLHDALPILAGEAPRGRPRGRRTEPPAPRTPAPAHGLCRRRSEEHTSELQSRRDLVCRLLLEKKKKPNIISYEATKRKIKQTK